MPQGIGAHGWQTIGGLAQRRPAGEQGPGGGPILFAIGHPLHLAQDTLPLGGSIARRWASAVARLERGEALVVKAGYEVSDGVPGAPPGQAGRSGVGMPSSHR